MINEDIFTVEGYDMVVTVTEKAINDQFQELASSDVGIIKTTLIVELTSSQDGLSLIPVLHDSWDEVPKDPKTLLPFNPAINTQFMPSISIAESGTVVTLVLTFTGGLAYMQNPITATMMHGLDMTGWSYGVAMSLNFAAFAPDLKDPDKKASIPPKVQEQLTKFKPDDFSVASLFMDFTSTDLMVSDAANTGVQKAGNVAHDFFVMFMGNYLSSLDPKKNPYVLGYAINKKSDTPVPDVVPSMLPVGNTFTVFSDKTSPQNSTINFCMNTKDSDGKLGPGIHTTPGIFDRNWLTAVEANQFDGKMIYSLHSFLETLLLKPFYETGFGMVCFNSARDFVDLHNVVFPTYNTVKTVRSDGTGIDYVCFDQNEENDKYQNKYSVTWSSLDGPNGGVKVAFQGHLFTEVTKHANVFPGTAKAWAGVQVDWSTEAVISTATDATGQPTVSMNLAEFTETNKNYYQGCNELGKIFGDLDSVFGGFANLFGQSGDLFDLAFKALPIDTILSVRPAVQATRSAFILPAGDVFFIKHLAMVRGPLELSISYKTQTSLGSPLPAPNGVA